MNFSYLSLMSFRLCIRTKSLMVGLLLFSGLTSYGQQHNVAAGDSITTPPATKNWIVPPTRLETGTIDKITNYSVDDLIRGRFSGLLSVQGDGRPGSKDEFYIRGISDFVFHTQPLIVMDGLPMFNQDINLGLDFDEFNNPYTMINPADIESVEVLKDASAMGLYGFRASPGVILIKTKTGSKNKPLQIRYANSFSIGSAKRLNQVYDANEFRKLIAERFNNNADTLAALGNANTDWQKEILQQAFGHNQYLTFSGSLKNLPYYASVGYSDQEGVLKRDRIKRLTYLAKINPAFFKERLRLNLQYTGSVSDQNIANREALENALLFDPTQEVYSDESGFGGYTTYLVGDDSMYPPGTPDFFAPVNPVAMINLTDHHAENNTENFYYGLEYSIDPKGRLKFSFNGVNSRNNYKRALDIPATASWQYNTDYNNGRKQRIEQNISNNWMQLALHWNHDFERLKTKFKISGSAYWQNTNITQKDNDRKLTGQIYNFVDWSEEYKNNNQTLNLAFETNNRYFLEIVGARNSSQRFGPVFGYTPSFFVKGGVKLNHMDFIEKSGRVDQLKLWLSYFTQQEEARQSSLGYLPPFTKSLNYGVDFEIFKGILSGAIVFYSRLTKRFIMELQTYGYPWYSDNVGNISNNGVEIDLRSNLVKTRDLNLVIYGNMSYNKNEITALDFDFIYMPNNYHYSFYINGTGPQIIMEGKPAGVFRMLHQIYDQNGDPIEGLYEGDYPGGTFYPNHFYELPAFPKFYSGLGAKLRYKKWNFDLFGRYISGHSVYNYTESAFSFQNSIESTITDQVIFNNRLKN